MRNRPIHGTDLIAFLIGTVNKLLGDHIQHCKAVFGNRIQLAIQALLHNLWQGSPYISLAQVVVMRIGSSSEPEMLGGMCLLN